MDIVDARAYLCAEMVGLQGVEDLQVGAGGFKRDDIGVHGINRRDDIGKLAIAHMRMNLCFWLDAAMYEPERGDGPVEVLLVPV